MNKSEPRRVRVAYGLVAFFSLAILCKFLRRKVRFRTIGLACGGVVLVALPILYRTIFLVDKAPQYLTAKVERGDIEDEVLAVGVLQAFRQVDVGAQVSGQLKELNVKLGDAVKSGQRLAEIDPVLLQNALKVAEATKENLQAQRRAAEAQLRQAEFTYHSQEQMLSDEATPRQDFEAARAQLEAQRANLASLDAQIKEAGIQVETAKANLSFTRITAPMEGKVVAIMTQQGQTVIAQQEVPVILKLADVDTMTVKAQISEADVIRVHPGQMAYFTILGDPDKRYYGKLRAIEPAAQSFGDSASSGNSGNSGSRSNAAVFYAALFDVPNTDQLLRISMTAQTHIVLDTAQHALIIPVAALGERSADGTYSVRAVMRDGSVNTRTVHTGIGNDVSVQVLSGLSEGEEVIIGEAQDASADASSISK